MAGPIAYLAPGNSRVTASARTCAVEWRNTSRPSTVFGVTSCNSVSCASGRDRSIHSPSALAASAALARPSPIDAATSPAVVPDGYSRLEPSGSVTVTWSLIASAMIRTRLATRVTRPGPVLGSVRGGERTRQVDAEELAELA